MSKTVSIFMTDNTEITGKLVESENKTSLLFSTENGRYYIVIEKDLISITLTGEVSYKLTLSESKVTFISFSYGANTTYPAPVTTHYIRFSKNSTSGMLEAEYSTSDYDEEYDGCEEDDRAERHIFSLSWIVKE